MHADKDLVIKRSPKLKKSEQMKPRNLGRSLNGKDSSLHRTEHVCGRPKEAFMRAFLDL